MLWLCNIQVLALDIHVQLDQFRRVTLCNASRIRSLNVCNRTMTTTCVSCPSFRKTVMGKKNASLYLQAFAKHFDVGNYERHDTEVVDLGERVGEIGFFTATLSPKTNQPIAVRGKYLNPWRKERWKTIPRDTSLEL